MNKNSRIISMKSDKPLEKSSKKEQEEWLNQNPTRAEVTQFVSAFVNNEVIPVILNSVGEQMFQLRCRNEVLLKFLIDNGICTVEEYESAYKEHYNLQKEELKKRQEKLKQEQESKIIVPDKSILY